MHISLADMLTFPPVRSSPAHVNQVASGAAAPRERSLVRPAPIAQVPATTQPKPVPVRPADPPSACLVTIGPTERVAEGVTYNRAGTLATAPSHRVPDLNGMTLEKQLHVGREMGVFTKITLHNDGLLVARPDGIPTPRTPEFVRAAVTTIRDFQEGLATLTQCDAQLI